MSDHEFEKQVQQKMDDLKFRPSDAVWTGVEKNIRRDKRRRRALIWLPLLFLLLATGGYVVFSGKQDGDTVATKSEQAGAAEQPAGNNGQPATIQNKENKANGTANELTQKEKSQAPVKKNTVVTGNKQPQRHNNAQKKYNRTSTGNDELLSPIITKRSDPTIDNKLAVAQDNAVTTYDDQEKTKELRTSLPGTVAILNKPIVVDAIPPTYTATPNTAAPKLQKKKTSKWQWGITGGAGISNVAEGGFFNILNKTKVEDLSYAATPPPSLQYNLAINPPQTLKQSPIEAGPAFQIGAFVKRNVSKKLSVSAGLEYNYFGLNTSVGELVKSSRTINVSFDTRIVDQYYGGNNLQDYTNQYHFIVLPVELLWRINKSEKTPVTLEGGIAMSQLIYTNALHFDGSSGIYYKDNSLFNKTQFDLLMGLNVGLLQNSKHPLSIGPDLHYSMTRLVKKEISNGQYLWSAGLSVKMLLKK